MRPSRRRIGESPTRNFLYVLPVLLFVAVFIYVGIAYTFQVSLFRWNGISLDRTFVGLGNYIKMTQDPKFWNAVGNTVVFAVFAIVIQSGIGLGLALLVRSRIRFSAAYKTLYFLPVVLAPAVVAYTFRQVLDLNDGAFNHLLVAVGLGGLAASWLGDAQTALFAVSGVIVWEYVGFSFLIYSAGLTQIEPELYEAASLDGASQWQVTRRIVIPLLRGTHGVAIILGLSGALKIFDVVYLTTNGGPAGASEFISTYLYKKSIVEFDAGYGAALSMVVLTIAIALFALQLVLDGRRT